MTNKQYLLDEYPLVVLPSLAQKLGINEAIVLQQIHFWLQKNGKQRDAKKWVYNSLEAWHQQFPFFSMSTLKRTFNSLEKLGILITGHYNKKAYDRTKWYSIDYNKLDTYFASAANPRKCSLAQIELMDEVKMNKCISSKCTNASVQNEQMIPHITTNTSTDTTTNSAVVELEKLGITKAGVREITTAFDESTIQKLITYAKKHKLGPAWLVAAAKDKSKLPPPGLLEAEVACAEVAASTYEIPSPEPVFAEEEYERAKQRFFAQMQSLTNINNHN
ncbi:hypothetical protein [Sporolituus thermophilus]|uniref:Uncharacterized protein n=1 Tax=Sporolituus thermophilus DSM 23256 TaxID=1123285 RepID=A0A1G7K3N6_9FIRM|nr:hypothetical protein [Sporolituus thermophilus]SDF31805.1 hypothetical protein SAMN05660235_01161 [Sporolituus thermophilus DSM 23256]